jgi:hypothetical protein
MAHNSEVLLVALFSMWSALRLYHGTNQVQFSECSAGEYSRVNWVGWWAVRGLLHFSHCELLLFEAGSWGMGIVLEPRGRGKSRVGSRYRATTGEDTAVWEDLIHAVVNHWVCELARALQLLVVMFRKSSVNPITNPNLLCCHHTCDSTTVMFRLNLLISSRSIKSYIQQEAETWTSHNLFVQFLLCVIS